MYFLKIQDLYSRMKGNLSHEMLSFKGLKGILVDRLGKTIPELLKHTLDIQGTYVQQNFNMMNHGLFKAAGEAGSSVLLSGFGGDELVSARTAFPWNEMILKREWAAMKDELFSSGHNTQIHVETRCDNRQVFVFAVQPKGIQHRGFHSRITFKAFAEPAHSTRLCKTAQPGKPVQGQIQVSRNRISFLCGNCTGSVWTISPKEWNIVILLQHNMGLEYRYPLLDVNLVLACLAFPARLKAAPGNQPLPVPRIHYRICPGNHPPAK